MMRVRRQKILWSLAAVAVASLVVAAGCGSEDEGATPKCDELPLYDASGLADPGNLAARQAAANAGCVTMPGDASSNLPGSGGTPGTGGTTATGGSAGSGGSAGGAQDAGGD